MTNEVRAQAADRIDECAEPRWGFLRPLLTAGFCPAKTARRTDHLGIVRSLATHVLAWLGIIIILPHVFDLTTYGPTDLVILFAKIEIGYLLLGLVLAAWGARQEPLRASLGRSFHRTLRHTPHLLQAFLLASLIAIPLFRADSEFKKKFTPERRSVQAELLTQGMNSRIARKEAKRIVRSRHPFYAAHGDECAAAAYCLGGLWFLWGWLSAIGAAPPKRDTKAETEGRVPLCARCDYNLSGLAIDGRCPECGEAVASSIGPDASVGTPWQRRSTLGGWNGFWRTTRAAFTRPTALGQRLIPSPDGQDNRSMVWIWCGINFVIAWLGWLAFNLLDPTQQLPTLNAEFVWIFCPFAGYALVVAALLVCIASAGFVGLFSSWKHKRNMVPATMQAASAAAGFGPIWLILTFAGWMFAFPVINYFLARNFPVAYADILVVAVFLAPSLMCIAIYDWLIVKIARGAQFANR